MPGLLNIAGRVREIARNDSLGDGLRFAVHACKAGPFRDIWLNFLQRFAARHGLPDATADLCLKPLNQHTVMHLTVRERIRRLMTHYEMTSRLAPARLLRELWRDGSVKVGTVCGRTGAYELWLCSTTAMRTRKEGEITVALREETGPYLAKLTFLLQRGRVMVGGVQGLRAPDAKERIVGATRDMFGLRPRDAILIATLAIANSVGAEEVWAVSSDQHVHNARGRKQQERLHFDYDAYWAERGALRDEDGGWRLKVPPAPPHTGKTANGMRRDRVKDMLWAMAQQEFGGTERAARDAAAPQRVLAELAADGD